jgi:hypothetical protein
MEKKNGSNDPCIFPFKDSILKPTTIQTTSYEKAGFQVRKQQPSIVILILFILLLLALSPLIWQQLSTALLHP